MYLYILYYCISVFCNCNHVFILTCFFFIFVHVIWPHVAHFHVSECTNKILNLDKRVLLHVYTFIFLIFTNPGWKQHISECFYFCENVYLILFLDDVDYQPVPLGIYSRSRSMLLLWAWAKSYTKWILFE